MSKQILLIEDNQNLAYGLRNNLEIEGYRVDYQKDGPSGLASALSDTADLIILDLMLPEMDGFHVLRELRGKGVETPVLILSARGEELDKVRGFRFGADQYLTKPFSVLELLARVAALLRRNDRPEPVQTKQTVLHFGTITVDPNSREIRRQNLPVNLSPKEFDLLLALLKRDGAAVSRLDLIQEVWGYSGDVLTRTVDTHIGELRRKLEPDPNHPTHILTVRKVGYRLKV